MPFDAKEILSTSPKHASRLFGTGREAVRKTFKDLAAAWHPDHSTDPKATEVFAHLVSLRDAALLGASPAASAGPARDFVRADGSPFAMRMLRSHDLDTGELLIGPHSFAWRFDPAARDVAESEERALGAFRFADPKMEREMRRFLPVLKRRIDLADGGALLVQARADDDVLLADLIQAMAPDANGIRLPAVHAAWIGSGLFHIACWLGWAGLVHGAIGPETVVVSPSTHEVRLLGGFGFSRAVGTRPEVLPGRSLDLLPRLAVSGSTLKPADDGELIRLTLREALGDPAGGRLLRGAVPEPLARFLTLPPNDTPFADYAAWTKALEASWGRRRFAHLDQSAAAIYGV